MGLTYDESIDYLENLYRQPFVPASRAGLTRARTLLRRLGDPHNAFAAVHVAGSTGKGSTTTMIGSILQEAGFRTGFFRSPHLVTYRERISVNRHDIPADTWATYCAEIIPIAEAMRLGTIDGYDLGRPTLFEILFALAALHFAASGVEWAAVETGLGGRLDATNLLRSDIAVLTNVSLEHTRVLGPTIAAIAAEKAAIIKAGSRAVSTVADPEGSAVVERRASDVGAPLLRLNHEIVQIADGAEVTLRGGEWNVRTILALQGPHQAANAAAAFGAAVALRQSGISLTPEQVALGLSHAQLAGRYELVPGTPEIILDGAHNAAGMSALADTLEAEGRAGIVLLFAAMDDKDVEKMVASIARLVADVTVTRVPNTGRSADPERIRSAFERVDIPVRVVDDPSNAVECALQLAGPDRALVVAGSLYLVGLARQALAGAAVA